MHDGRPHHVIGEGLLISLWAVNIKMATSGGKRPDHGSGGSAESRAAPKFYCVRTACSILMRP